MNNAQIANTIKLLTRECGKTITQVLQECQLTKSFIYDLEKRNVSPACDKLVKLADYFSVSIDYLLGRTTSVSNANENVKQLGLSDPDSELVTAILSLDIEDKAEIRGTVKQMLKAEKYNVQNQKRA